MTPRERKDIPWLIGGALAIVVAIISVFGLGSGHSDTPHQPADETVRGGAPANSR